VLLPGTLVAQLGHVLGLLLSGNRVQNTRLMGDDEKGDPESDTPDEQRLPVVGPVLIGLLPLVACGAGLYMAAHFWGGRVLNHGTASSMQLSQTLPTSLGGVWALLHESVDLMKNMVDAILRSDLPNWPTVLFLYLAICLTVRMAPFEGNRRGALGAILLAAVLISVVSSLIPAAKVFVVRSSWPILSFAVGMLLFLLLFSLLVRGVVGLIRILARNE
jgi:hypothetical protein